MKSRTPDWNPDTFVASGETLWHRHSSRPEYYSFGYMVRRVRGRFWELAYFTFNDKDVQEEILGKYSSLTKAKQAATALRVEKLLLSRIEKELNKETDRT